ncbi:Ig-like domain-containing protein [Roseicella frigidaeris]|uniref:Ig-like domain-containing protein n=1 Tax=Roseicella frigidaeris TaxID=2230885 RepID=UPI001401C0C7|nr:Ig-like domain-containing protein [Roseicella frigidaeris]
MSNLFIVPGSGSTNNTDYIDLAARGGGGANRVWAGGGADRVIGSTGQDTLHGEDGNDQLVGDAGADSLDGGADHDALSGGAGNDTIEGGEGNDTASGGADDDSIAGGAGADMLNGDDGHDTIDGGAGDDALTGGNGNDLLQGGEGDDRLNGGAGQNTLQGGEGDDSLTGGADADALSGDAGADTLLGGDGADTLDGGDGDDVLMAGAGDDLIMGGEGDDTIDSSLGRDTVLAGEGDDRIKQTLTAAPATGLELIDGGAGWDTLHLALTRAQWFDTAIQADIAGLRAHIAGPEGQTAPYAADALHTAVTRVEAFDITVDGVTLTAQDDAVAAADDSATASLQAGSVTLDLLANDSAPDLVRSLALLSGPAHGSLVLNADNSVTFTYGAADFAYLPQGGSDTVSFAYRVTDADGDVGEATARITVTGGVNDAPVAVSLAGGSVRENLAAGTVVGTLAAVDPDGDAVSFAVTGDKASLFEVVGNELRTRVALDYEAATQHLVGLRATDSHGATLDTAVTVQVTDEVSRLVSYTQSATQTTAGQDFALTFAGLAPSDGQAGTLTVIATGDLDSNGLLVNLIPTNPEYVTLGFAGQSQRLDIQQADSVKSANGVLLSLTDLLLGVGSEQVTLTKAYAIAGQALQTELADGQLTVTADLSALVNAAIDSRDGVAVTLSYYALV